MRIWAVGRNHKVEYQGGKIVVDGEEYDIRNVEAIYISPATMISHKDLARISGRTIVFMFGRYGLRNVMIPMRVSKGLWSGKVAIMQAKAWLEKRIEIARKMERAIITNIHHIFKNTLRKYVDRETREKFYETIRRIKQEIENTEDTQRLMLLEAKAWKTLFGVFRKIMPTWPKRIRRPPGDPANAIYSYLASLLYADCLLATINAGLDPSISFIHEPEKHRFSLPLDIKDIYAPLLVANPAFTIYKRAKDRVRDYFREVRIRGKRGVYLNGYGRRLVMKTYMDYLAKEATLLGRRMSIRSHIYWECRRLREHFLGESEYVAFRLGEKH